MATTGPPTKVTTGTATKTMLQIVAPSTRALTVVKWGVSFDGSAAGVPIICELVETGTVAATITTAYVANDIQKYDDPNSVASQITIGSTTASGYTATSEGSVTATRYADLQMVQPTNQYEWEWSLGREFKVKASNVLRIRVTATVAVNCLCNVLYEE
jgi:uncharacterized membrane protein